jgi:hypothetical protein
MMFKRAAALLNQAYNEWSEDKGRLNTIRGVKPQNEDAKGLIRERFTAKDEEVAKGATNATAYASCLEFVCCRHSYITSCMAA